MAQHNLESLLALIRDGAAGPPQLDEARRLLRADERLPSELREEVDFDDPVADAVGLLAVLGCDPLFGQALRDELERESGPALAPEPLVTAEMVDDPWPLGPALADAVWDEAGTVEIVDATFAALQLDAASAPVAAAVVAEAGAVEVADAVLARLGLVEASLPLAQAVSGEAGAVDLVGRVEDALTSLRLPLAQAVAAEAGAVEIADAVVATIGGAERLPVAAAVRDEAGAVQLWRAIEPAVSDAWVSAMLDGELTAHAHRAAAERLRAHPEQRGQMTRFARIGSELRTAVTQEGGECPPLWPAIAAQLGVDPDEVRGWDGAAFAEAVRAEAGQVDVRSAVMRHVTITRRMPAANAAAPSTGAPANQPFGRGTLMMMLVAAVLLVAIPQVARVALQGAPDGGAVSADHFASAGEIVVEELDYGDEANVYQATGDQGALILWVDEGKTL